MLSINPFDLAQIKGEYMEKQILRVGLISELDTVNLIEQLASISKDEKVKAILDRIVKEEKAHIGALEALLLRIDEQQMQGLAEGTKQLEELDDK
jgi:rubrerythrin